MQRHTHFVVYKVEYLTFYLEKSNLSLSLNSKSILPAVPLCFQPSQKTAAVMIRPYWLKPRRKQTVVPAVPVVSRRFPLFPVVSDATHGAVIMWLSQRPPYRAPSARLLITASLKVPMKSLLLLIHPGIQLPARQVEATFIRFRMLPSIEIVVETTTTISFRCRVLPLIEIVETSTTI